MIKVFNYKAVKATSANDLQMQILPLHFFATGEV
jgi:hypothetical protein